MIVLIVVVGPDRLPAFMKTVGKGLRTFRQASTDLRKQSGIDELLREGDPLGLKDLKDPLNPLARTSGPAPQRSRPLDAVERDQERPSEGVDLAFASLGKGGAGGPLETQA
ncbi:MAG: twin-arginine translocase TatA/TatE family subunit, partial [Myxococcales bacterium]|nr:twin-arginine translocase TatA/TatE family subunit [Myxococcales bacterium]